MNDFWQENKRLCTFAGCSLLVFLIGYLVIDTLFVAKVRQQRGTVASYATKFRTARYTSSDRNVAAAENEALRAALADLQARAEFQPRPEFRLPPGSVGDASQVYFSAAERVQESIGALAGRKRIVLPQGLDLDMVMTNSVDVIERNLAALDLLDRALQLAIENDVKQIRRIRIDLDPAFRARRGMGAVEETTVEIEAVSAPETITDWLQATQTERFGQVLPIRSLEARVARAKFDELRLKVTFTVVRLHLSEELADKLDARGNLD